MVIQHQGKISGLLLMLEWIVPQAGGILLAMFSESGKNVLLDVKIV